MDFYGMYIIPEIHTFGSKYFFMYCSSITAFVDVNILSKIHPVCHNIANGIEPGSGSKTTNKHAVDCSKAVHWGVKRSV